jgi:hypothetical protein
MFDHLPLFGDFNNAASQHCLPVRQAILELIARPPQKCPHCRKRAAA